jgi:hypothetical protein
MEENKKIEEASENAWLTYEYEEGNLYHTTFKGGFKKGAKWQAEKMYSEEDMQEFVDFSIHLFINGLPCIIAKDWFELYKKDNAK